MVTSELNVYLGVLFLFVQAHEALTDSKNLFEEINNELHKELPHFNEYRVEFLATNFMKLFNAEATFHTNTGKVWYPISISL